MSELLAFNPRIAVPVVRDRDGTPYNQETQARLTFPDAHTAVSFLNIGCDPRYATITIAGLEEVGETTTGHNNEYDAFMWPSREEDSEEVTVMLRRYVFGDKAASAALSEFVLDTTQRTLELGSSKPVN